MLPRTDSVHMLALDRLTVTVLRHHQGHHHRGPCKRIRLHQHHGDPTKPDRLGELFPRLVRDADLPPIAAA